MSVLMMGPSQYREIEAAVARARDHAIPLQVLEQLGDYTPRATLMLKDRKASVDEIREFYRSENVMLGTYRAAFSFEHQPDGLCRHLSVSSQRKGMIPGNEVMQIVAKAFGISDWPPKRVSRVWVEEFEPGHMAVNVIEMETE